MNTKSTFKHVPYHHRRRQTQRHHATYGSYSDIAQLLAGRLLERFDLVELTPSQILDLSCTDGHSTVQLEQRFSKARTIGVDITQPHLAKAKQATGWFKKRRFVTALESALPFQADSMDCIYANLLPTWQVDPLAIFTSCKEVIRDNGLILFSTLGPDSLREVTQAWQQVDPGYAHCHQFIDMHDIGDALSRSGFSGVVMESEPLTIEYETVAELHNDLRLTGSANLSPDRRRTLTGKHRFAAYEEALQNSGKRLQCTLEVVYGHAWAGYSKAKIPEHDYRPVANEIPTIKID